MLLLRRFSFERKILSKTVIVVVSIENMFWKLFFESRESCMFWFKNEVSVRMLYTRRILDTQEISSKKEEDDSILSYHFSITSHCLPLMSSSSVCSLLQNINFCCLLRVMPCRQLWSSTRGKPHRFKVQTLQCLQWRHQRKQESRTQERSVLYTFSSRERTVVVATTRLSLRKHNKFCYFFHKWLNLIEQLVLCYWNGRQFRWLRWLRWSPLDLLGMNFSHLHQWLTCMRMLHFAV